MNLNIYLFSTPSIIFKYVEIETIWIDETNHLLLSKINEMIEHRTEQIESFFTR